MLFSLRSSQCKRAESRISSKIFSPAVFSATIASLRFKGRSHFGCGSAAPSLCGSLLLAPTAGICNFVPLVAVGKGKPVRATVADLHRGAAIQWLIRHSLRSSCNQSYVSLQKPGTSVASDGSDSKASLAQVACQSRPSIKLLHVRLFGSTVMPAHLSEGRHPMSQ